MGAESFFVHVLPAGVEPVPAPSGSFQGASGLSGKDLVRALGGQPLSQGKYLCERILFLTVREQLALGRQSAEVTSVVLEGCFACYSEALEAMLLAASRVPGVKPARFFHPLGVDVEVTAKEAFVTGIRAVYEAKHRSFQTTFGDLHFLTPPNSYFYDEYKNRSARGGEGT
jgi:hypothetical protein